MRVVQVVTQRAGGPVDHAVDVARVLVARGVQSHLVGPGGPGAARARAAGVTWHERAIDDKRDLDGAVGVTRLLRDLRPDVVHLQDRRAGWLGRLLAPGWSAAVVYTLHGVPDGLSDLVEGNVLAAPGRRRDRVYYLHGERWVTRWAGCRVVVPSHAVAAYAVRHVGLPPDRVDVVHNGVDLERFRPEPHAVADSPTAVWLGLLEVVKRPVLLLDAVARVPDLRLLVLGDGPLAPALRERVRSAGLASRVELAGERPDPGPRLAAADLFVLTSAAENLPLALLQAMACGLPVVATAVGGVPEVVRPGEEGLLVPADDEDALVHALTRLSGDAEARTAMGRAARARVEAEFGLDRCVDGLLAVYDRAIAERGSA